MGAHHQKMWMLEREPWEEEGVEKEHLGERGISSQEAVKKKKGQLGGHLGKKNVIAKKSKGVRLRKRSGEEG